MWVSSAYLRSQGWYRVLYMLFFSLFNVSLWHFWVVAKIHFLEKETCRTPLCDTKLHYPCCISSYMSYWGKGQQIRLPETKINFTEKKKRICTVVLLGFFLTLASWCKCRSGEEGNYRTRLPALYATGEAADQHKMEAEMDGWSCCACTLFSCVHFKLLS